MKILINIGNDSYIRNYIKTGAFKAIQNHDCSYIAEDTAGDKALLENIPNFSGYYRTEREYVDNHLELLNVLMWRYRKKSKTFFYRFLMIHWPLTAHWYRQNKTKNILRWLLRMLRALKYPILGSRIVSLISVPLIKRKLKINRDIQRLIEKTNPDLVIIPCSAYDPIGTDIVRLGKNHRFRTLFLIDNWDNLSSKSILWALPDYMGVWGDQSKEQAVNIHGMARERVTSIGTPRFEEYFSTAPGDHPSPYPFAYVLFCGCAEPFDELNALRMLDDELSEHAALHDGVRIVYRPHPARQERLCPDQFEETEFSRVILDTQAKEYYYGYPSNAYRPSLNYYPALLFNAKITIAPLTTMMIESLVCGTQVVAIAYDDEIHFTSPHKVAEYATHTYGIDKISGLHVCREKSQLGPLTRRIITDRQEVERSEIHSSVNYFLYHDGRSYPDRLADIVDRIEKGIEKFDYVDGDNAS